MYPVRAPVRAKFARSHNIASQGVRVYAGDLSSNAIKTFGAISVSSIWLFDSDVKYPVEHEFDHFRRY